MQSAWSRSFCAAVAAALASIGGLAGAAQPPPRAAYGFRVAPVVLGLYQPIALAFAPDGSMLIAERRGRVLLVPPGQRKASAYFDVPGCDFEVGEGGLLGLALDPAFADNGWFYVFFTLRIDETVHSRIARYTLLGDKFDATSEFVLWQTPAKTEIGHFSGCVRFGPDGMLYASTGDNWRPERSQDRFYAQGKILRMQPDGAPPKDNPFFGDAGVAPYVWALGFRNPFRFQFDPAGGDLYVGDVGYETWEEVDRVQPADNGGWPEMEGPQCFIKDCDEFLPPLWFYEHGDTVEFGRSITMGPAYRSIEYPPEFVGNLFVGDFIGWHIKRLIRDEQGDVIGTAVFVEDAAWPVDMTIGPDGRLYYVSFWGENETAGVFRVERLRPEDAAPVAVVAGAPRAGSAPLAVQFSSAGSYDPDGFPGPLTYSWDFDDGASSTLANPLHTFERDGAYQVRLTLSDGKNETISDAVTILVGAPPTVSLLAPDEGVLFRAGDVIAFAGEASDGGKPLGPEAFSWSVRILRPGNAVNLFLGPLDGQTSGQFTVPTSGRPLENSRFEIELTVTTPDGRQATAGREIAPLVSPLTLETQPPGIPLFLDEYPRSTPDVHRGPVGYEHKLAAQATYQLGDTLYRFVRWSDSDALERSFVAPEGGATFVALYEPFEPEKKPDGQTSSPDDDPGDAGAACMLPCAAPAMALAALWLASRRWRRSA